jgi:hypothetical protein
MSVYYNCSFALFIFLGYRSFKRSRLVLKLFERISFFEDS